MKLNGAAIYNGFTLSWAILTLLSCASLASKLPASDGVVAATRAKIDVVGHLPRRSCDPLYGASRLGTAGTAILSENPTEFLHVAAGWSFCHPQGLAFVDKVGRKPLLLLSTAGMALSLFMLYSAYSGRAAGHFNERAVLWWILAYVSTFSIAMGPIVWVLISELFPNRARGRCAGIAVFFMWSASLAISQFFPFLLKRIDHGVFLIFGVLCVISVVYILLFVPETKGKTLEEIEHLWYDRAVKRGVATRAPQ